MGQAACRPQRGIDEATGAQVAEDRLEMPRGPRAAGTFEPILVEQGGEGGLAEFDLPKYAEQRGECFLIFAGDAEQAGGAIPRCPRARLRAGAATDIHDAAARRGRKLG